MEKKISQLFEGLGTKMGQLFIGIAVLLTVLTFSIFMIWDVAGKPFADVRHKAFEVARQYADLQAMEQFVIYNGQETYFSLQGLNSQGQAIAVLVPEGQTTVYVYPLENGLTEEEAGAKAQENGAGEIERAILGYKDGRPIWELKSGGAYYLVDFETGDFIKKEGL